MDQQQYTTPNPAMNPSPIAPVVEGGKKSSAGSIVGAIIVIIMLIFGGLYFWGAQLEKQQVYEDELPFLLGDEEEAAGIPYTSTSDDVSSIEADVSATNLDAFEAQVDEDMAAIETQL